MGGQDENNLLGFYLKLTMTLLMSLLFRGTVKSRSSELISDKGDWDNWIKFSFTKNTIIKLLQCIELL